MKRKILFIFPLLLVGLSACDDPFDGVFVLDDYHMFSMSSAIMDPDVYFDAKEGETFYIQSFEELQAFEDKITDEIDTSEYVNVRSERFNETVDFSTKKIAVTATYADHSDASFVVKSIIEKRNQYVQNIEVTITIPAVAQTSYSFLYVIMDKSITKPIVTNYKTINDYNQYVVYKPIVYFYPQVEMELKVSFADPSRLITTYPKYNDGWDLLLKQNGTFNVKGDDREYYALYFDEILKFKVDFSTGFYVTSDEAISFLENTFDYIGYSQREVNELVMYWLPILEQNGKSLVYIEQTDERNYECPMDFSVEPDTLIRSIIHIKKIDKKIDIEQQKLTPYERIGFTVVEWGGVIY